MEKITLAGLKELIVSRTNFKITVETPEEQKAVQQLIFNNGGSWRSGDRQPTTTTGQKDYWFEGDKIVFGVFPASGVSYKEFTLAKTYKSSQECVAALLEGKELLLNSNQCIYRMRDNRLEHRAIHIKGWHKSTCGINDLYDMTEYVESKQWYHSVSTTNKKLCRVWDSNKSDCVIVTIVDYNEADTYRFKSEDRGAWKFADPLTFDDVKDKVVKKADKQFVEGKQYNSIQDSIKALSEGKILKPKGSYYMYRLKDDVLQYRKCVEDNWLQSDLFVNNLRSTTEMVERNWYDEIPFSGVWCKVSGNTGRYYALVTGYSKGSIYPYRTAHLDWLTAEPLTEEELKQLVV